MSNDAKMEEKLNWTLKMMQKMERELDSFDKRLTASNESTSDYIRHLENHIGDIEQRCAAADRSRAHGDEGLHDLVTRTANSIYEEVKKLEQRISDCELAVGTDKLVSEQEPPVDTSWHPYYAEVDGPGGVHPRGDKRVVVMLRVGSIMPPKPAADWIWGEGGKHTIVAWRFANKWE